MNRNITNKTEAAKKGRMGDTYTAHVQDGEMIIPDDLPPELMRYLQSAMAERGFEPEDYTVGGEATINPETGEPEYFSLKKILKPLKKVANVVLPQLGAVGGFTNGLVQGEGLSGALKGGLRSGINAAATILAPTYISPALSSTFGLSKIAGNSLASALASTTANKLTGASTQDAIMQGGLSGLTALYQSGGFKNMGNAFKTSGLSGALSQFGDNLSGAGDILEGSAPASANAGGGTSSYAAPASTTTASPTTTLSNGETITWNEPMANESILDSLTSKKNISSLLSSGIGTYTNDKASEQLLEQQKAALSALQPYLNFQFNPQDLQNDAGYKFQLEQGQKALDSSAAAKGSYFSGDALRSAGSYATGLADQTYNQAYNRALEANQSNINNILKQYGIQSDIGTTKATNTVNNANLWTDSIANLLGQQSDEDILMRYLKGAA